MKQVQTHNRDVDVDYVWHEVLNKLDIVSYLSAPNLINTLDRHVGEVRRLYLPKPEGGWFQSARNWFMHTVQQHKLDSIIRQFDPLTCLGGPSSRAARLEVLHSTCPAG